MTQNRSFDEIESRLGAITEAVSSEETSLDEALSLFEEAVKLGLEACEITDSDVMFELESADGEDATVSEAESEDVQANQAEQASSESGTESNMQDASNIFTQDEVASSV